MRILSIYYTHKPGGFCKRLYRMLNALARAGHNVTYLTLDKPPAGLEQSVNVRQIPFPFSTRDGLFFWLLFTLWCPIYALLVSRMLRPERYAVFGAYYSTMLKLSRRIVGGKIVLFMRSLVFKINRITEKAPPLIWAFDQLEKAGVKAADLTVCMTNSMHQDLENFLKIPIKNAIILPNDLPAKKTGGTPIDLKERFPSEISGATLIALTSGVLDKRKNLTLVLTALSLIPKQTREKIFLVVAGDGELLELHRAQAKALNLQKVGFLGWCDSLDSLYEQTDLLIHPSLHEGMPNSVLEALAADLPVLVADSPELLELVQSKKLTFDAHDARMLASILGELTENPSLLEQLRRHSNSAANILRFDWEGRVIEIISS